MRITPINPKNEMDDFRGVVESAFSTTPDSSLDEWLSFPYMKLMMEEKRGFGLKAVDDDGNWVGAIYAQQENPVNGKEGEEKWVIIVAGTDAKHTGGGIGSQLLSELEALARKHDVKKLFTFTNKDDEQVINFYRKNGYEDAGWIKDYQYGGNNSAVFLLKHLV